MCCSVFVYQLDPFEPQLVSAVCVCVFVRACVCVLVSDGDGITMLAHGHHARTPCASICTDGVGGTWVG